MKRDSEMKFGVGGNFVSLKCHHAVCKIASAITKTSAGIVHLILGIRFMQAINTNPRLYQLFGKSIHLHNS